MKKSSDSSLYGKGIFTTLAFIEGEPFVWEKHWRRLAASAERLGIDISGHGEPKTLESLLDAIADSGITDGRARVTFHDESPSPIWSNEDGKKKTSFSIVVAERRSLPKTFRITVSPHRVNTTSPLIGIKSCNYLEHLLAVEEAKDRGFHEAIRVNERGEIASACMANVFWEKYGRLFTPSLATGCLAGTTREYILENVECEEVASGISELERADRIFLTSAGIGVAAVADFDGRVLDATSHRLTELIAWAG